MIKINNKKYIILCMGNNGVTLYHVHADVHATAVKQYHHIMMTVFIT